MRFGVRTVNDRNRAIAQQAGQRERRLARFLSPTSLAAARVTLDVGRLNHHMKDIGTMTDDLRTPDGQPINPEYSDVSFWEKLRVYALAAGKQVVEMALQLYYALQSPVPPMWAKSIIIAALAYFIMPLDAIPDVVPVVGYSDDLGALAAALAMVAMYITDEIKAMARAKMEEWFGKN